MPRLKPDNIGQRPGVNCSDIAIHFRAKDEKLTELLINDSSKPRESDEIVTDEESKTKTEELAVSSSKEKITSTIRESDVKDVKMSLDNECSPSPSEYKRMFRNLNDFTEKITRTVEEKISEIKSDISSGRSRLLSSKDSSSISDSEDPSESSKLSDVRMVFDDSSNKSRSNLSEFPITNVDPFVHYAETEYGGPENELRRRRKYDVFDSTIATWDSRTDKVELDENIEIEHGIEVDEQSNIEELAEEEDAEMQEKVHEEEDVEMQEKANEEEDAEMQEKTNEEEDAEMQEELHEGGGGGGGGGGGEEEEQPLEEPKWEPRPAKKKQQSLKPIIYVSAILVCIFVVPFPAFIKGFVSCLLITYSWSMLTPKHIRRESLLPLQTSLFRVPDYSKMKPLVVPRVPPTTGIWFNELPEPFIPEIYSSSLVIPVHMEIDNHYLKLSRPREKIGKRALCDEPVYKLDFINQRIYDLGLCQIVLKPDDIPRRRFFSKKFPIYVKLEPGALVKAVRYKPVTGEEEEVGVESTYEIREYEGRDKYLYGKNYLNLFARCKRQKEEWYRRLKAACTRARKAKNKPLKKPGYLSFEPEEQLIDEYWNYMSQFVGEIQYVTGSAKSYFYPNLDAKTDRKKKKDVPGKVHGTGTHETASSKGKDDGTPVKTEEDEFIEKSAVEVQWLNAFVNRFLFDVFRAPYWIDKVRARVEKRIRAIRLPYYVETVEVIEFNMGKIGPRFHRVSRPTLDHRGVWFDLDLTYDGSFKLTLQTKINLVKLQRGVDAPEQSPTATAEKNTDPVPAPVPVPDPVRFPSGVIEAPPTTESDDLLLELVQAVVSDKTLVEEIIEKHQGSPDKSASSSKNSSAIGIDSGLHSGSSTDDTDESDDDEDAGDDLEGSEASAETAWKSRVSPRKAVTRKSSKKIFRVMETIAQSKYFKSIAETKYMQKFMAGMSATKFTLLIDFRSCIGTMAVNLPPPPCDRVWFGFRTLPKIWMLASPKIGKKTIHLVQVKRLVEKKLIVELKKNIIMPNMHEILLPYPPDDGFAPTW